MKLKTIAIVLISFAAGACCAAWYMHTQTPEYQLRLKVERHAREVEAERADMQVNWRPPAGDLDSPAWFPDSLEMPLGCTVQSRGPAVAIPGFEGMKLTAGRTAQYYHFDPHLHVYVFPSPGEHAIDQLVQHEPSSPSSKQINNDFPNRWVHLTYGGNPNAKDPFDRQADRVYEFWHVGGYLIAFHARGAQETYSFAHAYMKATDGRKK